MTRGRTWTRWAWVLPMAAALMAMLACTGGTGNGAEPTATVEADEPTAASKPLLRPTPTESSEESAGAFEGYAAGQAYESYVLVTDEYKAIQVEIPEAWSEVDGSPWMDGEDVIGASIWGSPDLQGFADTWDVPGVMFDVSDDLARLGGYVQLLDYYREDYLEACKLDQRYDYEDTAFRGKYDLYKNCGGPGGPTQILLTAVPKDNSNAYLIRVGVTIISDADWEAVDHIMATFDVIDTLP
jgi:serine protease Do